MALIRNGSHQLSGLSRFHGAVGAYGLRSALDSSGQHKNFDSGGHAIADVTNKAAIPSGYRPQMTWKMGTKAGGLSSHSETEISVGATGVGAKGVNLVGSTTVTINASALGGLIAGGVGNATISITATGAVVATIGTTGSATVTIGAVANIGALGWMVGESGIDITASLVPYAIGHMEGTTAEAGLTPTGIANQVWAKVIEAGFSAEQIMRLLAAATAGSATGLEGANPQFTGLDGSTVRIDGTYAAGTRTIDALNGD